MRSGKRSHARYRTHSRSSAATSLTTGGNQDAIIACRPNDCFLFESKPRTVVLREVLSGTLQARIQLRGYAAFICRYPAGVSVVSGTGNTVQAGFTS